MVRQVWTSNSGTSELSVERAAEMKIISKKDPVLLDLLLDSNLLQQELTRMNINSRSLLDKTDADAGLNNGERSD